LSLRRAEPLAARTKATTTLLCVPFVAPEIVRPETKSARLTNMSGAQSNAEAHLPPDESDRLRRATQD